MRSAPAAYAPQAPEAPPPEVSVVIPCLNESDTLASCIEKAQRAFREYAITGEVIVADNGSSDGSPEIASRLGARLVPVAARGYGNALMGGIAAARGAYIIMGDADDSYDFLELPKFVARLREGFELVQGCRLPAGGGRIAEGAMPFLHRWCGNPMFSSLAYRMFQVPLHDVYCGFRGFTRALYERLNQRCTGMEFATEMVIKASLYEARITEVPITLHRDGRRMHPPHLRTFRDGWRTLRFFLLCCPRWLFLAPGTVLVALALLGYGVALPGLQVHGVTFDAHTLLVASLAALLGYQAVLFGVFAKTFAVSEGLLPEDTTLTGLLKFASLEKILVLGLGAFLVGLGLVATAVHQWWLADFGPLDYAHTMRFVVPGVTLAALGFQTMLASFLVGILALRRM